MSQKNVVITGSSRGIGLGLAREFLKEGHKVTLSGRSQNSLLQAKEILEKETESKLIDYLVCDVTNTEQVSELWKLASNSQKVDLWINNAGLGQATLPITTLSEDEISAILDINIKGLVLASRLVAARMQEQESGAIYNMEGFGSDGRKLENMTVYGTSKRAVRYFSQSLALELKNTNVIVGTISPGMVLTDLLLNPISEDSDQNRQAIKIFNILADKVETVTPFLVSKMLHNKKNGININWLTNRKVMARFIKNIFVKRKLDGLPA